MPRTAITKVLILAVAMLGACTAAGDEPLAPPGRADAEAGGDPSPAADTEAALASGSLDGRPTATCVEGWTAPAKDSPLAQQALRVIRRTMRFKGSLEAEEMRYFEGPESPPSEQGYLRVVKRWYVKGHLASDPLFRGRWLVERRTLGAGVAAVAPYDTSEYRSPDWTGFQYEAADPERRSYPGLPGRWRGTPYDFVNGDPEMNIRVRGLPDEVVGCLAGT